jgi:hypothetical protein
VRCVFFANAWNTLHAFRVRGKVEDSIRSVISLDPQFRDTRRHGRHEPRVRHANLFSHLQLEKASA